MIPGGAEADEGEPAEEREPAGAARRGGLVVGFAQAEEAGEQQREVGEDVEDVGQPVPGALIDEGVVGLVLAEGRQEEEQKGRYRHANQRGEQAWCGGRSGVRCDGGVRIAKFPLRQGFGGQGGLAGEYGRARGRRSVGGESFGTGGCRGGVHGRCWCVPRVYRHGWSRCYSINLMRGIAGSDGRIAPSRRPPSRPRARQILSRP